MNRLVLLASALAAFTAGVHVLVGTEEIAVPLLGSSLAPELSFLLYAWASCLLLALTVLASFFRQRIASSSSLGPPAGTVCFLSLVIVRPGLSHRRSAWRERHTSLQVAAVGASASRRCAWSLGVRLVATTRSERIFRPCGARAVSQHPDLSVNRIDYKLRLRAYSCGRLPQRTEESS